MERLRSLQYNIAVNALQFLKPSGKLVYITCSALKEENEEIVKKIIKNHGMQLSGKIFKTFLASDMDVMFSATLERKN